MNKRAILGAAALTMLVVVGVVVWLANRQEGFDRSKAVPGTATPLASVVAVASPTPQVAPASTPEGGTTITFAVWEEDRSVYGPLKDAFEAEHPGLHVRLLSLEDVVQKRTLTNNGQTIAVQDPLYSIPEIASAADAAAVALPAEAMSKGYMRDLKPLMDADPQFDRTDFYTGTLESLTRGRSTYLLPSYVNVPLLNYNKDLWTAAQVGGPNTGWKWADLLGAADKLALTNGNKIERYGTMGWGNGVDSLLAELHVAGVDLDPAGETRLDTPEVAAAFNRVVAWAQSGMVYVLLPTAADAGGATPGSDETSTLIMGGKVGLWSPNLLDETQADLPFATGVLPSPSAPSFAEGYVMSSGTQHPQETWQWLSFLSKQEIPWTHGGPFPVERVPARKSVALSSGYWTKLDAGTRAAVEAILEGAATQPLTLVNSRVFDSDTLAFALREVASGKTTAEQALRDVQAEIDSHALPPVSASNPVVVAGPATTATLTLTLSPQSTAATGTSTATAGTQVPLSTPVIDPSLSLDQFYEKAFMDLALRSPELYTELGLPASYKPDFRHDSLTDVSDAYTRETYEWAKTYLAGLRKYDRAKQTAQQLISTGILDWYLDDMVRGEEFMYDDYIVNPLFGVQNNVQDLMTNLHPLTNKEQAEDYVTRLKGFRAKFGQVLEVLRIRDEKEIYPPRSMIGSVLDQMRQFVQVPVEENAIYTSFVSRVGPLPNISDADKEALYGMVRSAINDVVYPAYLDLITYFEGLQPKGRDTDGVWALPNGDAYYRYALRHYTTTDMTPQEVHDLGLKEVERIRSEMRTTLDGMGYQGVSLKDAMSRVARAGGVYRLDTPEQKAELLDAFRALISNADKNLGSQFDIRPHAGVEVRAMPEYRQSGAPGGNYIQPSLDGSRPGVFYVNLGRSAFEKYQMPTLAYHEAIPGHHFQLTLQTELQGVPTFRRSVTFPMFTAYIEGWGLYAERLAAEAGLYKDDPYGQLGQLQSELFRAARLVVDTGIHYKRWTRQQAIDYMSEATASPEGAYAPEVDRYIAWPGQACAYKVGELKIMQLRERARAALGSKFDIKEFHDVVLQNGSMPLTILEQSVDRYIATKH